jgi:hypothetical protein
MNSKLYVFSLFLCLTFNSCFGQTLSSSDIPIIIINTGGQAIPNEPKIVASFSLIANESGKRNTVTDAPVYSGKIGIELRGSTSQQLFPKKPYGIELRDPTGLLSVNASLLGMPAESDWVMNATYNDKTLIREALVYDLNRKMSSVYTPRFRYCELLLNGKYEGIYILFEKIKRDKNRIDMATLKKTDISGDQLTGGYLLKIDKTEGSPSRSWTSPQKNINGKAAIIQIDRPKPEDLAEEQFQYIKKYVTDFENALANGNYRDPVFGYRNYVDELSVIDYVLITEMCRNVDGYRLSTFFYKDKDSKGGKLVMGPIWDYNLSFGNADYCDGNKPEGWEYNFNRVCPSDYFSQPFWWERFLLDTDFTNKLSLRYKALRQTVLTTDRIHAYIDSSAKSLTESRIRNFTRWPVIGQYVWPNGYVGKTYEDDVSFTKDWIRKRLLWMDGAMPLVSSNVLATDPDPGNTLSLVVGPVPMAETVTIRYRLDKRADVTLSMTDATGRSVFVLEQPGQSAGEHEHVLNNNQVPTVPGVYILKLQTDGQVRATRKVVRN